MGVSLSKNERSGAGSYFRSIEENSQNYLRRRSDTGSARWHVRPMSLQPDSPSEIFRHRIRLAATAFAGYRGAVVFRDCAFPLEETQ